MKYLGSKLLKTERLELRTQTIDEQKISLGNFDDSRS